MRRNKYTSIMLISILLFLAQTTTTFNPLEYVRTMAPLMYRIIGYLIIIAVPLLLIYAFLRSTLGVLKR